MGNPPQWAFWAQRPPICWFSQRWFRDSSFG